jgi:hypothetical protein
MKDIIKNAKGQKIIDTLDEYYRLEERVPSSVAEAEFNYMKLLRRDAKGHEGKELGYLDFAEGMANSGDHFVYKNYVSYKYGALRSALRKNFGTLTSIPFFTNQSLNTDRELYRDALSGVLSTFPRGPTNGAIIDLVKSITKTAPKINELSFGSWILGRDYLNPQQLSYKGSLEFADGKFGSGLKINKDNG